MKQFIILFFGLMICSLLHSQDSVSIKFKNQYNADAKKIELTIGDKKYTPDPKAGINLLRSNTDSFLVSGKDYDSTYVSIKDAKDNIISLHKRFTWTDLLTPMFYIIFGGLWFVLFAIFAETGLFAGFFLPGDSLLFVAGIFSENLFVTSFGFDTGSSFINLVLLGLIISAAGVLGNFVGYWFGKKSGPFLFERKDTFFFKKKYLFQAKEFYDKHGGGAIVFARFLPIIRTFAPIIAGIVDMEKKKFTYYNVLGCVAWVFSMLFGGHYLQILFLKWFNFDLKEHLEVIVIGIVLITTAPILIKLFFGKTKSSTDITT